MEWCSTPFSPVMSTSAWTGVRKVELHEDPEPHPDRASLVEHDEVAFREGLGEHAKFVGVVEVVGTDRGEDGQLEFFERLSVLDGQRNEESSLTGRTRPSGTRSSTASPKPPRTLRARAHHRRPDDST